MVCSSQVGFRVEGVTEASLTSDVFVACLFQHSCRWLAGLSPGTSEGVAGILCFQPTCPIDHVDLGKSLLHVLRHLVYSCVDCCSVWRAATSWVRRCCVELMVVASYIALFPKGGCPRTQIIGFSGLNTMNIIVFGP